MSGAVKLNRSDVELDGMSPEMRRELAARVLSRRSLIAFTKRFYPQYQAGWVHEDMARRLEKFSREVAEQKSPRLMILMPPRHGKSELASIRFPAWHLGHYPQHEIINCGYNLDLPMRFSRKVREILRDPAYPPLFPNTVLDPDSQATEAWLTTGGGGFTAAGVGGGITGKGAHILIIDDPIKNQEEADSINTRESLWDWYWSTAYTRLAPGAGVLVIQTWWHDDDLAGRLQSLMRTNEESDQFYIVKYPMEAEADEYIDEEGNIVRFEPRQIEVLAPEERYASKDSKDTLHVPSTELKLLRYKGEPLHPERYDTKMMRAIKANQPPRVWSALYQQNPVPDEGAYFRKDYFRYEPVSPSPIQCNIYQAWDFAIGEKQYNDYNVGVTLLQDERDYLHVVEVVRFKGDSFTIVEEILNAVERWGSGYEAHLTLGVEDSQIWKSIKPLLKKRMAERTLYTSYEELRPLTDKLARARPLQGRMQQGRVYFPAEASWRQECELELLRFPAGAHDDIVDALAWAVHLCINKAPRQGKKPPTIKSWRDKLRSISNGDEGHMSA